MNRRVRSRVEGKGKEKVDFPEIDGNLTLDEKRVLDWTSLPDDTVITVFSHLNHLDRASLSSTCRTWRTLGKSPCLWQVLDLRTHKFDAAAASSLASRCENLRKIQFRGTESADAIINLRAKNLREISGDRCRKMTDITLCVLAARHEALECLQIGADFCEMISSDAIKAIAICCPQLRKLWFTGIREVDANAINALGKYCQNLTDIGFINCQRVDETALGNVVSVRFLSMAGTTYIQWDLVVQHWSKLPHLIGLDVSRTNIPPYTVSGFFSSSFSLKVLCALNCPALEEDATFVSNDNHKGTTLLLSLTQSAQEKVQERAATALATFVKKNYIIDTGRAEAVMRDDGIRILLNLAQSRREGLQSEAVKARFLAIAILSVNAKFAKSCNGGRRHQHSCKSCQGAIEEAGGIKALVDLIFKWSSSIGGEVVLKRVVGALANLTADEKYSIEFASVGGVHALVTLARSCKAKGVQEQAARALTNFTSHGDTNHNAAAVGQETGALDALVQLIRSRHDGVRQEAAGALWNLSSDDRNQEAVAAAGGVEALVALAHSCSRGPMSRSSIHGIQETAAGALWGLSGSESNSIAIGRGGVVPLIALARSDAKEVHETAAGALWSLGLNPGNALRIVEEGGVPALVHLCSSSVSKMARFLSALALANMFDGRMDEVALIGTSTEGTSKSVDLKDARRMALQHIKAFVMTFSDPQLLSAAAASSASASLLQVTESVRIQLRCRLVAMLHNPSPTLKSCAAFALLQFTIPGVPHAAHHTSLLQSAGAPEVLRLAAAAAGDPLEAKIARIVLRNLEQQHHMESVV
ncbi:hypothetical protein DH2020_044638 [Rehmannia glutinosa]|uniref:F-box domain-containing protein n=1 Tax=Rehmannia glutinosa TaxID=99300 RepID=A0ABR0UGL8_REHGL